MIGFFEGIINGFCVVLWPAGSEEDNKNENIL